MGTDACCELLGLTRESTLTLGSQKQEEWIPPQSWRPEVWSQAWAGLALPGGSQGESVPGSPPGFWPHLSHLGLPLRVAFSVFLSPLIFFLIKKSF